MMQLTTRSSNGDFTIALSHMVPNLARQSLQASVGIEIAGQRFGTWADDASTADYIATFCDSVASVLRLSDEMPTECRGELLALTPLEFARAMEAAPQGELPSLTQLPRCRKHAEAGTFVYRCFEIGSAIPHYPDEDRFYLMTDSAICRVVACKCRWIEDECDVYTDTVVDAWVSRDEMERILSNLVGLQTGTHALT